MPFIQCYSEKNRCKNNIIYDSIDNHSENNTGLIIGLIVSGIIIVSLIITFVIFKIKYSKNTEPKSDPDPKHKLDIKLDTVAKPKDFQEVKLDPKPYPYLSKDTEEHVYSNMPKELKTDNIND